MLERRGQAEKRTSSIGFWGTDDWLHHSSEIVEGSVVVGSLLTQMTKAVMKIFTLRAIAAVCLYL